MTRRKNRVCPVELAGSLDNRFRRWFQNPGKLLAPYIMEGMRVLDVGCGPGFFTIDLAQMVGASGHVIAADLQEGMLQKVKHKIVGTELEERITLHLCEAERIGVSERVDFVLAVYVLHEMPCQDTFFREIATILEPRGLVFLIEPPFHVSRTAFQESIACAREAGLRPVARPIVLFNRSVLLKRRERVL